MDTIMNRLERELEQIERQLAGLRSDVDAAETRRSTLAGAKDRLQAAATDAEALFEERPLELSGEPQGQRSAAPTPPGEGIAPDGAAKRPWRNSGERSRRERLLERLREQRPDLLERVERGELGVGKAAMEAGWHRRAGRPRKEKPVRVQELEQEPEPTPEPEEPRPPRIVAGPKRPEFASWPRAVEEAQDRLAEIELRLDAAAGEDRLPLLNQRRAATARVERLKGELLNSAAAALPQALPEPHHGGKHG